MPFASKIIALSAGLALVFACAARADDLDLSTPRKTAILFARAVMTGDMKTVKDVSIGTDAEFALVKNFSDLAIAVTNLEKAATARFGSQGKLSKVKPLDLVAEIEQSQEKINGDAAVLINKNKPDDKFPPACKKDGAQWKMDLSFISKDPQSGPLAKIIPTMLKVMDGVTKNIAEGTYKTPEEASDALAKQMDAALSKPKEAGK